jgi:microcystin-dependent protein
MATTYTDNLRISKQGDGDNSTTWGQVVNTQIIELFEDAISGVVNIDCTGSSNVNISTTAVNGGTDDARNMILELSGALGANIQLIVPSVEKMYLIRALHTGGYTINVRPSGGSSGIDFVNGTKAVVYTSGTSIYQITQDDVLLGANNLSDVASAATSRTNLGLGTAAVYDVGTGANNIVQLDGSGNIPAAILEDVTASITPPGLIMPYAGTAAPTGWLLCYGQAISRATYASLFAITSTTYGVGDGSTTFNLPDIRGRVVAGQDDMGGSSANRLTGLSGGVNGDTLGATGGAETHTLVTAEVPSHSHTIPLGTNYSSYVNGSVIGVGSRVWNGSTRGHSTDTVGGDDPHNNVQPTLILNYIIKT